MLEVHRNFMSAAEGITMSHVFLLEHAISITANASAEHPRSPETVISIIWAQHET